MKPRVKEFFDEPTNTYSYVVADPGTGKCALVDTVLEYAANSGRTNHTGADRIIAYIKDEGLEVEWILETHVHADHLSAAPYLQTEVGGKIAVGEKISVVQETFGTLFNVGADFKRDGSQFDVLFQDGDSFSIGDLSAKVLHTPGHTPACLTYVIGDAGFVGDTLFMPDYGTARCDFPGGNAETLYDSIQKIFELPDTTRLFMCHDYGAEGREGFAFETTVGEEKAHNIHVHQGVSKEAFAEMRNLRDAQLDLPKIILPSVQVNMRAGHFPPAEDNGIRYLKIPIDTV
ncbi:MAG: MBL fold metallo-hydrolase [Alphaproteobacteria bacterium]|nr:MAG: MBL fold metallo-hydrolase [Alphaproteobacteria bacterium]